MLSQFTSLVIEDFEQLIVSYSSSQFKLSQYGFKSFDDLKYGNQFAVNSYSDVKSRDDEMDEYEEIASGLYMHFEGKIMMDNPNERYFDRVKICQLISTLAEKTAYAYVYVTGLSLSNNSNLAAILRTGKYLITQSFAKKSNISQLLSDTFTPLRRTHIENFICFNYL